MDQEIYHGPWTKNSIEVEKASVDPHGPNSLGQFLVGLI